MVTTIQIENVSKMYRIGQIGTGTISHDFKQMVVQSYAEILIPISALEK